MIVFSYFVGFVFLLPFLAFIAIPILLAAMTFTSVLVFSWIDDHWS